VVYENDCVMKYETCNVVYENDCVMKYETCNVVHETCNVVYENDCVMKYETGNVVHETCNVVYENDCVMKYETCNVVYENDCVMKYETDIQSRGRRLDGLSSDVVQRYFLPSERSSPWQTTTVNRQHNTTQSNKQTSYQPIIDRTTD